MKKFLLFILVANATAQAWPFHKKPKYAGVEVDEQKQAALTAQRVRIEALKQELLARMPGIISLIQLSEHRFVNNPDIEEEFYLDFHQSAIFDAKNKEVIKQVLLAKTPSQREAASKSVDELAALLDQQKKELKAISPNASLESFDRRVQMLNEHRFSLNPQLNTNPVARIPFDLEDSRRESENARNLARIADSMERQEKDAQFNAMMESARYRPTETRSAPLPQSTTIYTDDLGNIRGSTRYSDGQSQTFSGYNNGLGSTYIYSQ